jgi:hypothetical protein
VLVGGTGVSLGGIEVSDAAACWGASVTGVGTEQAVKARHRTSKAGTTILDVTLLAVFIDYSSSFL